MIRSSPCEVLCEPPRFAVRVNQTVELRGPEEQTLAEIEVVLVVDYTFDDGPAPGADATRTAARCRPR
ncbi:hypothetical protein AB0I93_17995 [Streptomyces sp. NPDC049967]|uniref:hypothetical protein n=1 Tax=unclassified Streptomyces TaxID=2593676 RepID=UPI0032537D4D